MEDQIKADEAGLIEDFFFVNTEQLTVPIANEPGLNLIDPFCITGPSVFEFVLAVSPDIPEAEF